VEEKTGGSYYARDLQEVNLVEEDGTSLPRPYRSPP
jgi:hypothetical protein